LYRSGWRINMNKETMQLIIQAKPNNVSFARAVFGAFSARLSPTLEQLSDIQTAVSETVTNCVVHAYTKEDERISITCNVEGRTLTITIEDYGLGIEDIEKAKQPFYSTRAHMERSGMGFTIMEAFMDTVIIESRIGKGTKVTLQKKIEKPESIKKPEKSEELIEN